MVSNGNVILKLQHNCKIDAIFFMQDTTFPVTLSVFVLPMKILRSHTEISRVSEDHTVVFGS